MDATPWTDRSYIFHPEFAGHLGGEEEFWTVDRGGRLMVVSPNLFERILKNGLRPELPIHQVESVTGICANVAEFERDLQHNRDRLAALGTEYGFGINTEPTAPHDGFEIDVYPHNERYRQILAQVPPHVLKNGWIIGLHLHYGCSNLAEAIRLMNGLRQYLPLFLSVSARSPRLYGVETGLASARFFRYREMKKQLVPPFIRSAAHLEQLAKRHGFHDDPKRCWWGLRINPVGTVELRICDMQETAQHAAELAALFQIVCKMILVDHIVPKPLPAGTINTELVSAARRPELRACYEWEVRQIRDLMATVLVPGTYDRINNLMGRMNWPRFACAGP